MSSSLEKFSLGLELPEEVLKNINNKRDNNELKIFAKNLPNLLYPDTYILAGRLLIYSETRNCPDKIENYVKILNDILRPEIKEFLLKNSKEINELLTLTYDYNFKYHNILSASSTINYLLRITSDESPVETPCQMMLRQAVQFYFSEGLEKVKECYYDLIEQKYIHASPTMFNAGTLKNQMSSCFLLTLGDNLESLLYTGSGDVGMISRLHGGIGLNMNNIRKSEISNSGKSSGVNPFCKIYDEVIRCVNQGGKRNGAMTISLIDWHLDFIDFIQTRDNTTFDGIRFKQANICAYISRLFMERVRKNEKWTLFCPKKAVINGKKLSSTYGEEFEKIYIELENYVPKQLKQLELLNQKISKLEKILNNSQLLKNENIKIEYHMTVSERTKLKKNLITYKTVDAREIYHILCDQNMKCSMPYIVYRDPVNMKNNMMNIGMTEGLNLCVAPETNILTDNGNIKISDFKDKEVNVWNGKEFNNVIIKQTGKNKKLLKILFDDGSELNCTHYHKFYIQTQEGIQKIEAKNLINGMKISNCSFPIIDKDNLKLQDRINYLKNNININCIDKKLLQNIKYMLQISGCNPRIVKQDGFYKLEYSKNDINLLKEYGINTDIIPKYDGDIKVSKIIDEGRIDDVYCFTENKRNSGIFNGIYTSQCLEITEPSTPEEIASCNLGHINLKKFIKNKVTLENSNVNIHNLTQYYDFKELGESVKKLTNNINKVIDYNYYPLDKRDENGNVIQKGKISTPNLNNRPIGIGVSGLGEVFSLLKIPYESEEAKKLNKLIFACMYYNSLYQSHLLALKEGEYKNFRTGNSKLFIDNKWTKIKGSPLSNGYFQFDLWNFETQYLKSINDWNDKINNEKDNIPIEPKEWGMDNKIHSWNLLRQNIIKYGVRNSMLLAPMPTASSSQIVRNSETTEAHQTLLYSRKLSHGNFTVFSEPFIEDMRKYKLWNNAMIEFIELENGSIQNIDKFIRDHKNLFKFKVNNNIIQKLMQIHRGMFEISQKTTTLMTRQRGIYICQSQSLNIYLPEPSIEQIKAIHSYTNSLRLKTGMYYLRANPASQTERFTVSNDIKNYHEKISSNKRKITNDSKQKKKKKKVECTDDICIMCQ